MLMFCLVLDRSLELRNDVMWYLGQFEDTKAGNEYP